MKRVEDDEAWAVLDELAKWHWSTQPAEQLCSWLAEGVEEIVRGIEWLEVCPEENGTICTHEVPLWMLNERLLVEVRKREREESPALAA